MRRRYLGVIKRLEAVMRFVKKLLIWIGAKIQHDTGRKTVFYHDVGNAYTFMGTERTSFWCHMKFIRPGDVICFDDGFRGIWDERENFRQRGLRPMVFLAVALVGQSGYLTWDEIRTLQNEYGFDFQCHTWSHQTLVGHCNPDLPIPESPDFRTDDWYRHELLDAKAELERQLGKTVDALCFPVGNFSDDVIARCKAAGYKKVYASYPGNVTEDYIQPRNLVQDMSLFEFKLVLKGGLMAFYKRYYAMHKYA